MNTLYITETGRVKIDENGNVNSCDTSREGISYIVRLTEDTKIVYDRNDKKTIIEGKAGDLVITFYEQEFPNQAIIVNSKEWNENLDAYEAWQQKQKEAWAAKKCEGCTSCEGQCNC